MNGSCTGIRHRTGNVPSAEDGAARQARAGVSGSPRGSKRGANYGRAVGCPGGSLLVARRSSWPPAGWTVCPANRFQTDQVDTETGFYRTRRGSLFQGEQRLFKRFVVNTATGKAQVATITG